MFFKAIQYYPSPCGEDREGQMGRRRRQQHKSFMMRTLKISKKRWELLRTMKNKQELYDENYQDHQKSWELSRSPGLNFYLEPFGPLDFALRALQGKEGSPRRGGQLVSIHTWRGTDNTTVQKYLWYLMENRFKNICMFKM